MDIPLHFTFLGQQRDDIVRLTDVNNKGELVPTDFARDGFLVNKKHRAVEIRCPGDRTDKGSTTVSAINNAGQIIGTYLHHRPGSSDINDYDGELAFLYDNGNFTPLDFPGAHIPFCCGAQTFPMDINNRGQLVGPTYNSDDELQSFLLDDSKYLPIAAYPTT